MKFCVHCGKPLPQQSTAAPGGTQKFCRTCGTRLDAASGQCPNCQGGRKKDTSENKGLKTLLIVILCLILLVALVGGVIIALDYLKLDVDDSTGWTEKPEEEPGWTALPGKPEKTEAAQPTVPETEDPAEAAFREVVDFCTEHEAQENYLDIVLYLKNLTESTPEDPHYQELLSLYEEALREQTLMVAEIYIEEGQFKQAALYIEDIQRVYDCDDFYQYLEICKVNLSMPLSWCTVVEDTNHSNTSSDVCPGDWEDVYGYEHEDSVRYWVIEKAGYQNTEYAVYQLDKEYRTLSGEIATEVKSEAGSDAVIMIYLDGVLAYTSPTVSAASGAVSFELDVTGVSEIKVLCTTGSPSFNYCIVDAMLYEI